MLPLALPFGVASNSPTDFCCIFHAWCVLDVCLTCTAPHRVWLKPGTASVQSFSCYLVSRSRRKCEKVIRNYVLVFSTMNDSQNLSHPEIEFRSSFLTYLPAPSPPRETLLDLLEVYPNQVKLKPKLDHASLIDYFSVSTRPHPVDSELTRYVGTRCGETGKSSTSPSIVCDTCLVTPYS